MDTTYENQLHQGERPGTQEPAGGAINKAKEAAASVAHSLSEADVRAGVNKAKEMATSVAHSVSDAATYVGQKADSVTRRAGETLETTGHHLREDGLQSITADITALVRRNPIPALLVGFGLGYLLAHSSGRRI